jgi:hypothetical protein
MKGLISKTATLVCSAVVLTSASGCLDWLHPRNLWDPCWPQRYNFLARQSVMEGFGGQVHNGHVLDQTIWNYHFEAGSDKLTPGGLEHLNYLARRRPCPDGTVYLQTAQDIVYDAAAPEKFVEGRLELNSKRQAAIHKYLSAYAAGKPAHFEVIVHDPYAVGMHTIPAGLSVQRSWAGSQGQLPSAAGAGASNTSGGGQ